MHILIVLMWVYKFNGCKIFMHLHFWIQQKCMLVYGKTHTERLQSFDINVGQVLYIIQLLSNVIE